MLGRREARQESRLKARYLSGLLSTTDVRSVSDLCCGTLLSLPGQFYLGPSSIVFSLFPQCLLVTTVLTETQCRPTLPPHTNPLLAEMNSFYVVFLFLCFCLCDQASVLYSSTIYLSAKVPETLIRLTDIKLDLLSPC